MTDQPIEPAERVRLSTLPWLTRLSRRPIVYGAVIFLTATVSWLTRWVVDDAYITFRFSQNVAAGRGPVFNPGDRVEGYTNFLWMMINVIPHRLGWDPLPFAQLLGLGCFVAIGVATVALGRRVLGPSGLVLIALLLVAGNGTVIRFATSGMETCLAVALVLGAVVALTEPDGSWTVSTRRLAVASGFAGLAVLTRLDTVIVLAIWFLAWARARSKLHRTEWQKLGPWVAAIVPALFLVVPWLIWKQSYYGQLLPNTFTAKSGGVRWQMLLVGAMYLGLFVMSYALVFLVPRLGRLRTLVDRPLGRPLLVVLAIWPLYVLWVGGDWMEFRFMTMYVPFMGVAVAWLLDDVVSWLRHAIVVGALALASVVHVLPLPVFGIFSPLSMDAATSEFRVVGEELQRQFPGDLDDQRRPMMAVGAAGALVYFSEVRAVDVLGLTDATVAETGERADFYFPGHQIISPIRYLVSRNVNLVLVMDGPIKVDPDRTAYRLSEVAQYYPIVDLRILPKSTTVVEIPTPIGTVRAIELIRHPMIDELVDAGTWKRYPIEFVCDPDDIVDFLKAFGTKTCPDL